MHFVVEASDGRPDAAAAHRLAHAACAVAGVTPMALGLHESAERAIVPIVEGCDLLGRWIRGLHVQVEEANERGRTVRARLGLVVHLPAHEDAEAATSLALCQTGCLMHTVDGADVVIIGSVAFYELVVEGVTRFPRAEAYRSMTVRPKDGAQCWVAVTAYPVCPGLPAATPSATDDDGTEGRDPDRPGPRGDTYRIKKVKGKDVHIGPSYGRGPDR
jgi:hypothetical protein